MRRQPKPIKEFGRYGSVGIELVLSIVLGYMGGKWLDDRYGGGRGWLTAVFSIVGVYAGFRALFLTAAQMQRDVERAERAARGENPWASTDEPLGSTKEPRENAPPPHDDEDHLDRS